MASPARHLSLLAFVVLLAVVAPHASAWGGGRFFFSKTTRPEAAVDAPEKASVATTTAVPTDAANPNSATEFSRPSTGGGGRGYGLYGCPEENFRRDVHHNAEKLTTTNVPTTSAAADEALPVGGRGERTEPLTEDNGSGRGRPPWTNTNVPTTTTTEPFVEDNGSGRGRPPWTNANLPTTSTTEETFPAAAVGGRGGERSEPFAEDNGSGMGRWPWRYGRDDGRRPEEEQRNYYGMSDTRLYQNGRYYYDVDTGRYGYGRESNPVRTRPEEFGKASDDRRGRYYYGNAAAGYYQYGNGNELGNGVMENQDGFHVEGRNGRFVP